MAAVASDALLVTEVAAAAIPTAEEETLTSPRLPLCGWLLQQTADAARSSQRRYFTMDFSAQILYDAQSEANKSVSTPIAFRDLISVEPIVVAGVSQEQASEEPIGTAGYAAEANQRPGSTSSSSSLRIPTVPCISGLSSEQYGFALRTRSKNMELICGSKSEADSWNTAILEALVMVGNSSDNAASITEYVLVQAEPSTAAGSQLSSRRSSPSPQAMSPRSVTSKDASHVEVDAVVDLSSVEPVGPATSAWGMVEEADQACQAEMPQSDECRPDDELTDAPASSSSAMAVGEDVEEMSVVGTPRGIEYAWDLNAGGAKTPGSQAATRYQDKAQGLSLHQRLSQLDFSDDEGEEASLSKRALDEAVDGAPTAILSSEVETQDEDTVESFQVPVDSDDD